MAGITVLDQNRPHLLFEELDSLGRRLDGRFVLGARGCGEREAEREEREAVEHGRDRRDEGGVIHPSYPTRRT